MKRTALLQLAGWIVLCQMAGGIGAFFTTPAIGSWYAYLVKPELAPPNWVFGPVWTTLYVLMGIAAFWIWRLGVHKPKVQKALLVFCLQLALNILWSVLFFGMQSPLLGLLGIGALWLSIALTIRLFYNLAPRAGLILLPYLAWVSFASYLNYMLYVLN